jgi:hypothetical protein
MISRSVLLLSLAFIPGLLLSACGGEPEPKIQIGGISYTADEVGNLSPQLIESLADLTAFGQAVARDEISALGEPLVDRQAERARLATMPLELGAREMGLTEDALRRAYAENPEWELRVRHVVRLAPRSASDAQRAEARVTAEEVRRRALAGENFAALAAEFSEEPGAAESGGLLDAGRKGSWVAPFWEAARALQPGEISPVTETQYGFHVLRLEGREPVPFEEADRRRLLASVVPAARAGASMRSWAEARAGSVVLDPPAILRARETLESGDAPDSLILARWPGGEYSAWDLALYQASLDTEARERFADANDAALGARVEADAIEAMWSDAAQEMGIEIPREAQAEAAQQWEQRAAVWAAGLGLREGLRAEEVRATALRALASTGQESRIARLELAAIRPLLRRRYAVAGPLAASSSSETRKRESTR